jgi:NodT family efflux transporter outer membrane factor (OMF) lipoprotein
VITLRSWAAPLSLVLFLAGCGPVGPNYHQPQALAPALWNSPLEEGLTSSVVGVDALARWWESFNDPRLTAAIRQALVENNSLAQARAAWLAARARRQLAAAPLLPTANVDGTLSRQGGLVEGADHSTSYRVNFDSAWELDLFGGRRRTLEAADSRLTASEAELGDARISLVAEVALTYLEVGTYQKRLEIAVAGRHAQERLLSLTEAKHAAGLVGELAVQQGRTQVAATRAQIPGLQADLARTENLLATLIGVLPGSLNQDLPDASTLLVVPPMIVVAIPAATLERRPDVRRAERLLAAQVAEIGAAEAARYPTVRLSGVIGFDALTLGNLFSAGSGGYSISPGISWNLFDGGSIAANITLQSALAEAALAAFKETVLAALAEVENAITAYVRERQRLVALEESVQAAARSVALGEAQYRAGLVELATVLEAQRTLLSYQDQQAVSNAAVAGNLIKLYKALGGGWEIGVQSPSTHAADGE